MTDSAVPPSPRETRKVIFETLTNFGVRTDSQVRLAFANRLADEGMTVDDIKVLAEWFSGLLEVRKPALVAGLFARDIDGQERWNDTVATARAALGNAARIAHERSTSSDPYPGMAGLRETELDYRNHADDEQVAEWEREDLYRRIRCRVRDDRRSIEEAAEEFECSIEEVEAALTKSEPQETT